MKFEDKFKIIEQTYSDGTATYSIAEFTPSHQIKKFDIMKLGYKTIEIPERWDKIARFGDLWDIRGNDYCWAVLNPDFFTLDKCQMEYERLRIVYNNLTQPQPTVTSTKFIDE